MSKFSRVDNIGSNENENNTIDLTYCSDEREYFPKRGDVITICGTSNRGFSDGNKQTGLN